MRRRTFPQLPPGPPGLPLLGSALEFRRDAPEFMLRLARRYGPVASFHLAGSHVCLLSNPADVERLLKSEATHYLRGTRGTRELRVSLGDSLLTTDGELWLRRRRMLQPAFHWRQLAGFGPSIREAAAGLCERLERRAQSGEAFDLVPELLRVTLEIIGRTLLSLDLSHQAGEFGRAFVPILRDTIDRASALVREPLWVPTPRNRRLKRAVAELERMLFGLLRERRARTDQPADLLALLLSARDEATSERLSDQQLRDELITMVFAGHETTATALAWTFYELSRHPHVTSRLQHELTRINTPEAVAQDELAGMGYTRMVIEEAIRLHPPVWIIPRKSTVAAEFGGYVLPARTSTVVSPYVTHRDPNVFRDPDVFDPDRFDPASAQARARHRYAYFPFGGGPHICIGAGLAMMEAQMVVASVLRRFRLRPADDRAVEHRALVALRPQPGVFVRVERSSS